MEKISYAKIIFEALVDCYFFPLISSVILSFSLYLAFIDFDIKYTSLDRPKKIKSVLFFWYYFFHQKSLHFLTVVALNTFFACRGLFISLGFGAILKNIGRISINQCNLINDTMVLAVLYFLTALIASFMESVSDIIMSRLMPWLTQSIRSYYFDHICNGGYRYKNGVMGINKMIDLVGGSINCIESLMKHLIPVLVFGVIGIVFLFSIDRYFFLLYLLWCLLQISISVFRTVNNNNNSVNTFYYKCLMSKISDTFRNIFIIKAHKSENFEKKYFISWSNLEIGSYIELRKYNYQTHFILNFIYYLFFNFIFIIKTSLRAIIGDLSIDKFSEINSIARFLSFEIWGASRSVAIFMYELARVRSAIGDLNIFEDVLDEGKLILDIKNKEGKIEFCNVDFGYSDQKNIIQGLNLELSLNKRYAIVGPSGSGKSSIISLLLRFFNPTCGEILINGINIKEFSISSLRDCISFVPQSNEFFERPIFTHFAYGCSDIRREMQDFIEKNGPNMRFEDLCEESRNRIMFVIEKVKLTKVIERMPDGLNTIYNGGLSGGQKQRMAIGAAIIKKKTAIMILDEPTSALDAGSEMKMLDLIKELSDSITVIQVSHRLSTLRDYTIIMLKKGSIAEIGTHAELINKKGEYYQMYSATDSKKAKQQKKRGVKRRKEIH